LVGKLRTLRGEDGTLAVEAGQSAVPSPTVDPVAAAVDGELISRFCDAPFYAERRTRCVDRMYREFESFLSEPQLNR
jgi:hypothetical protein